MLIEVSLATWVRTAPCQCVFRVAMIRIVTLVCLAWEEKVASAVPTEVSVLHLTCVNVQKGGLDMIARLPFARQK